jgi:hypothetical protein
MFDCNLAWVQAELVAMRIGATKRRRVTEASRLYLKLLQEQAEAGKGVVVKTMPASK